MHETVGRVHEFDRKFEIEIFRPGISPRYYFLCVLKNGRSHVSDAIQENDPRKRLAPSSLDRSTNANHCIKHTGKHKSPLTSHVEPLCRASGCLTSKCEIDFQMTWDLLCKILEKSLPLRFRLNFAKLLNLRLRSTMQNIFVGYEAVWLPEVRLMGVQIIWSSVRGNNRRN